jgi:hypothetical protein
MGMRGAVALFVMLAVALPGPLRAADLAFPGTETGVASAELPPLPAAPAGGVDLGALQDRALAIADAFPATNFDLDALSATLAGEPMAAFAYVRDHIALDPYAGVLRGAAGTLGARAGNSQDRALLLADLLQRMGVETRFVAGTLDADGVAQLAAAALQPAAEPPAADGIAALAGLSPGALDRLQARARRDLGWLWPAVGDRLAPAPEAVLPARHVWVRALVDGTWIDLDPSLPQMRPGRSLAVAEATFAGVPDDDRHAVALAVLAETLVDGVLGSEPLLEVRIAADEAADQMIFLSVMPEAGGGFAGVAADLAGTQRYVPVLSVGDDVRQGAPVPSLGSDASGGADAELSGDAQDFFFGEEGAAPPGPVLTALYLDVTIESPGREPMTARRVLVDRVPAAARPAGAVDAAALLDPPQGEGAPEPFETVHQVAVSTGAVNPHKTAVGLVVAAEYVGALMASPDDLAALSLPELLWPVGAFNRALVLASEQLAIDAMNDLPDARFFAGAPRVFILSFSPRDFAGNQGLSFAIDLLHDGVAAVAADGVPAVALAERRLWYGVVQSALETTLAEVRAAGFVADSRAVTSTSIAMTPDQAVLTAPDGAPAALLADLAAGRLVVANAGAAGPELTAWWAIDPADGSARAVLAPSLGGAGGTGWRPPPQSFGGDRIIINEGTANTDGFVRNGRDYRYNRRPPGNTCRGGSEYQTILGCVSIPVSMAVGTAYAIIVGEILFFAALTIAGAS